jgi:hypothetical protein
VSVPCSSATMYPGPSSSSWQQNFACTTDNQWCSAQVTLVNITINQVVRVYGLGVQLNPANPHSFSMALYDSQMNLILAAESCANSTQSSDPNPVTICPVGDRAISPGTYRVALRCSASTVSVFMAKSGVAVQTSVQRAGIGHFPWNIEGKETVTVTRVPNVFIQTTDLQTTFPDGAECEKSDECAAGCCCETDGGFICSHSGICSTLNGECVAKPNVGPPSFFPTWTPPPPHFMPTTPPQWQPHNFFPWSSPWSHPTSHPQSPWMNNPSANNPNPSGPSTWPRFAADKADKAEIALKAVKGEVQKDDK